MPLLINERWPSLLAPETCSFRRMRFDVRQESPATQQSKVIRRSRPLWAADVSWNYNNDNKLALLRYYLESLDGHRGSVQIWNFASPYPFGIDLGSVTGVGGISGIQWTYLSQQSSWTWSGLPSHWVLGATASIYAASTLGLDEIYVNGLDANKTAALIGQYVQVGRRLYICRETATASGAGAATIKLTSGLLAATVISDTVRLVQAGCEMELIDQTWDESATAGQGFVRVSAKFRETRDDKS